VRRAGAGGVTAGMLKALVRQALCTVPMRGSRLPALRGAQAPPLDSYRAANNKTHDQPHPAAPQQERRPAPAAPPAAHRRRRRRGPRAAAAGVPGPRRRRPARRRAARGGAATQPWRTYCRSRGPRCPPCRARGSGRRAPRRPRPGARRAPDARAQSPRPARVRSGVKRGRRWWSSAHSRTYSVLDMAQKRAPDVPSGLLRWHAPGLPTVVDRWCGARHGTQEAAHRRRRARTGRVRRGRACWLDRTSQMPSHARIRNSSPCSSARRRICARVARRRPRLGASSARRPSHRRRICVGAIVRASSSRQGVQPSRRTTGMPISGTDGASGGPGQRDAGLANDRAG
jgi:hypothetical protein